MTFKIITGLLSVALFFGAFWTWIYEAAMVCALLGFLSGMLFWGRVFEDIYQRRTIRKGGSK